MAKAKDFTALVSTALNALTVGNTIDTGKTGKAIDSIKRRGATLDVDIHAAAVACLTLSSLHRDANMAKQLLNSMPKGSRAQTLAAWFEHFGNVKVSHDKTKGFNVKMLPEEDCVPVDLVKAQATPFWNKPEAKNQTFNDAALLAAVEALIKRAEKDTAELSPAAKAKIADLKVIKVGLTPVAAPVAEVAANA